MDSATFRECVKALLAEGALALLVVYGIQVRHGLRKHLWATALVLVLAAAATIAGYFEFGYKRYGTFMNSHDVYHYYTGTKYAPELGYTNQYAASLLADHEQKKVYDGRRAIRNLETHGYTNTREVFDHADDIKGRFTPERWEDFKKDILYFQGRVPKSKWQQMLRDKGYNGTPVWSMIAGALTNAVSTDNESGMLALVLLDPILLGIMFSAIWWAFGPWCALFAIAFFGTNFVTSFVHIKGALLRMDWVVCIVLSMCLVHKRWFKTAGVVLAYAAAARVFPFIFAYGLGALACWELLRTRKLDRDYIGFFATFAITAALLGGASYLYYGGDLWREFSAKIAVHNNDISTTRVGFKYIFLWPFESFGAKVAGFKEHQTLWWSIQAGMLAVVFLAARTLKPYQAIGLGFVPAFFLTAPTFYYYVLLIAPLLIFLTDATRVSNIVGAGLFFTSSVAAYLLHFGYDLNFTLSFFLSCMYGVICLYIVGYALFPTRLAAAVGGGIARPTRALYRDYGIARPIVAAAFAVFIVLVLANSIPWSTPKAKPITTDALAEAAPTPATTAGAARVEPTSTANADPNGTVTLALVGDVMLSRNVARDLKARNRDFTYPFEETVDLLAKADIVFGNLECPVSGRGEAITKKYLFNAPAESVEGLAFAPFDILSLANNHTLDYGPIALDDTLRLLGGKGIMPAGITTADAPQRPVTFERNGIRVGFLAYCDPQSPFGYAKEFKAFKTGPAVATDEALARDIAALKPTVDIVIVSIHWGIEYQDEPNERQIQLAHTIIDLGANVLAGHHPHVQQDAEWYQDGFIVYSLGNFVFDQHTRPATRISRLYEVTLTKQGPTSARYIPLEIALQDWQPRPTTNDAVVIPHRPTADLTTAQ